MAFFNSKSSRFSIEDTGGAERDLSAYLTEVAGLPGRRVLDDITSLADTGRRYMAGPDVATFTLAGMFDDTATTGPDAVLGPLRSHSSSVAFSYGPGGGATGDIKYSGSCWVESYEILSSVGSRVQFSASLKVDGAVTRGTY